VNERRGPGRLWLFFWGRRRRGFPGLLVALLAAAIGLGLTYALPHGVGVSYVLGLLFLVAIALLVLASIGVALFASLRPRGRR
jgi:fucose permease